MAMRDGYCAVEDLLITQTRFKPELMEAAVAQAADEIDGEIGVIYETPVMVNLNDPAKRQDTLTLKKINTWLASGRLLTSASAGGEQSQMHAYGEYLIRYAYADLKKIVSGTRKLTSAVLLPVVDEDITNKGPRIVQGSAFSMVDGFYDNFAPNGFAPERQRPSGEPWPQPGPIGGY